MYQFSEGAVHVVAAGAREAIGQIDASIETTLRVFADVIAATRDAGIPAAEMEALHEAMLDVSARHRELRRATVKTVNQLLIMKRKSNQAETDVGCPVPWGHSGVRPQDAPVPIDQTAILVGRVKDAPHPA